MGRQIWCHSRTGLRHWPFKPESRGSSPRGITIGNAGFGVSPCNVAPTKIPNGDPLKKN